MGTIAEARSSLAVTGGKVERGAVWRRRAPWGERQVAPRWSLAELAGRLTELSGLGAGAQLTLAFCLVEAAQQGGEPAAWVSGRRSTFFPPDAAAAGIDLARLPVVFTADPAAAARAAERLLRSGAFGLVVLDLVGERPAVPPPLLSRLVGLAQKHAAAVVFLTEKPAEGASLGSLVSLRCQARRERTEGGRFHCRVEALKDKRRGPGWTHAEVRRGPLGLR